MEEERNINCVPSNSVQLQVVDNSGQSSSLVLKTIASGVHNEDIESKSHGLFQSVEMKLITEIKWMKVLEVTILSVIILLAWSLLTIPTIMYALPPRVIMQNVTISGLTASDTRCDRLSVYEGQICSSQLATWQKCFSTVQSSDIRIPSDVDQQEAEDTASMLINGLPLLSPSPQCEAAIKPFLCLYLFGSCDSDNQLHRATQADCLRLRDEVCAQEWVLATRFLGEDVLPDCNSLSQPDIQCVNNSISSSEPVDGNIKSLSPLEVVCAEGYYLNSNTSLCRPLCTLWTDPPGVGWDSDYIATLISVIIAVIASVAFFIVAFTLQRSTMLKFPTLYLVYCCVTVVVIALLFLIGFVARENKSLFCSSKDLFEAFEHETAYCTIIGVSFTYGLAQIAYWAAFHAASLCWGIVFPFHFRKIKMEGKIKYFHITTVLLGLILPTIPALLHLKDGYTMTDTPTTVCTGRNQAITYFSLVLPLSCLIAVSSTALIVFFWKILKAFVLKKLTNRPRVRVIGKAQAKILFIVFYYIILGAMVLTTFTYFEVEGDQADRMAIENHFICQSTGVQANKDCGSTPDVHLKVFNSLSGVAIILLGLLPAVIFGFTVNCDNKRCRKRQ